MVQTSVDWNSALSQSAFSFRFAVTLLSPGTLTHVLLYNKMNTNINSTSLAERRHFFHNRAFPSLLKCKGFKIGYVQSTGATTCHLNWMHSWCACERSIVYFQFLSDNQLCQTHPQSLVSEPSEPGGWTNWFCFPYLKSLRRKKPQISVWVKATVRWHLGFRSGNSQCHLWRARPDNADTDIQSCTYSIQ